MAKKGARRGHRTTANSSKRGRKLKRHWWAWDKKCKEEAERQNRGQA